MFDALCQCYADPKLTGFVRWKDFVSDVENKFGHTQSGRGEKFSATCSVIIVSCRANLFIMTGTDDTTNKQAN